MRTLKDLKDCFSLGRSEARIVRVGSPEQIGEARSSFAFFFFSLGSHSSHSLAFATAPDLLLPNP